MSDLTDCLLRLLSDPCGAVGGELLGWFLQRWTVHPLTCLALGGGAALVGGRDPKEWCAGGKAPPTPDSRPLHLQAGELPRREGACGETLSCPLQQGLTFPLGNCFFPANGRISCRRCAPHPALVCKRSGLEALGKAPVTIVGGDGNLE